MVITLQKSRLIDILEEYEKYLSTSTYLTINASSTTYDELKKRNTLLNDIKSKLPKLFLVNNKETRGEYDELKHILYRLIGVYYHYTNKSSDIINKVNNIVCSSNKSFERYCRNVRTRT